MIDYENRTHSSTLGCNPRFIPPLLVGMDILESNWNRTTSYGKHKPCSSKFQEYLFWRKVAILWACATVEAFVNEEGVAWLGDRFYADDIERLRVIQKIYVLYALKYRTRLPRRLGRLTHVQRLFELRNSIIHPKTREVSRKNRPDKSPPGDLHSMQFEHLRKVLWTVTALFEPEGHGETDGVSSANDM